MRKWILFFALVLSFNANASSSGDCGAFDEETQTYDDCHWSLDDDGHLKIWGTGNMENYTGTKKAPWGTNVNQVEIEGITSIGTHAFGGSKITQINVPSSVSHLSDGAFQDMSKLTDVTFEDGGNVYIDGAVFQNTPKLTSVQLPNDIRFLGYNNFTGSSLQDLVLPDSFFRQDGSIGLSGIALKNGMTIYCSEENQGRLENYLKTATAYAPSEYLPLEGITLKTYQKRGNEYYVDGKFYQSPQDIGTPNYIKKRIYTIDEANKVAGDKNRVSIKYR